MLLWNARYQIVAPFNETVLQVFARVSAFRDSLDGPQVHPHCGRSRASLLHASSAMRLWLEQHGQDCMPLARLRVPRSSACLCDEL